MNFQEDIKKIKRLASISEEAQGLVKQITGKELVSYEGIDALVAALMGFYNGELKKKSNNGHTHTKANITDFPTSLKNPSSLTVKANGTSLGSYDGSSTQTFNVTANGVGAYTKSEVDTKFKNFCPYAVGDVYVTTSTTNPAARWTGTTWQKIENRFLLGTSSSGTSKQTGGSNTKTISQSNLPAVKIKLDSFSFSRGTMEILGQAGRITLRSGETNGVYASGAFQHTSLINSSFNGGSYWQSSILDFKASRSWTGTTSTAQPQTLALGSGQALDITPSYYTVHIWLRLT